MAGHRRRAGKPLRADSRAARRRDTYTDRMGRARTPAAQVWAAANYLTGALSDLPAHEASVLTAEAVNTLVNLTKQAEKIARRRKSP
jgi:hypothetical protein